VNGQALVGGKCPQLSLGEHVEYRHDGDANAREAEPNLRSMRGVKQ
jgi:hypothetical protein